MLPFQPPFQGFVFKGGPCEVNDEMNLDQIGKTQSTCSGIKPVQKHLSPYLCIHIPFSQKSVPFKGNFQFAQIQPFKKITPYSKGWKGDCLKYLLSSFHYSSDVQRNILTAVILYTQLAGARVSIKGVQGLPELPAQGQSQPCTNPYRSTHK